MYPESYYSFKNRLPQRLFDKMVVDARLDDTGEYKIILTLETGEVVVIYDDGQSCCESRYITVPEGEVRDLNGGRLIALIIKHSENNETSEWGDIHEVDFVEIVTDRHHLTFCTHNEHNGYYGGFNLVVDIDGERIYGY